MTELLDESGLREKYQSLPAETRGQYALISLKVKRFRTINRLFGRAYGDALVAAVSRVLLDWIGEDEYVAHIHLGSFNLLVHFPQDYDEEFGYIIELNARIRDMADERFHGKVFCGYGIYLLEEPAVDFDIAQYNADVSRAKCPQRGYRNSHMEIYKKTYQDNTLHYDELDQLIQPALDRGDIKLYLQPQVDLQTGTVTGAEALVRWIDPERGMIPLSEFMPVLEENGLISNVDRYLFEEVCRKINHWIEQYGRRFKISVNLSASMFNYRYFFPEYVAVYERYNTPKELIEFELLESIVLNQVDRVREVVDELRTYGFSCALDDFGSGYSSYSVLTNTGITAVKIDRSLFCNERDDRERIIVRHIIQTAKELGMSTVAEGVETRGYVDYLREIGCDAVQGFVFYKPMPADEFERRFVIGGERPDLADPA